MGKPSTYRLADLVAWRIETALAKAEAAAPAEDLDTLRARKLEIENERRGLELSMLRGELVEAAEVSRVMHGLVAGGRAHVLAITPSRIAAAVADGESPRIAAKREIAAALASWVALGVEGALAEAVRWAQMGPKMQQHSRALLIDVGRAALVYMTPTAETARDRAAAAEGALHLLDKVTASALKAGLIARPSDDLAKQITSLQDEIQCEAAALDSAAHQDN
jgi:hypothetical protein